MVHLNPHVSLREIERTVGIPRSTASRYLKAAKYHPYHITLNQALTENDHRERLLLCRWATQQLLHDGDFLKYVLFSNEATFHSHGTLNHIDLNTRRRMWFQHDGADPHYANIVRDYLDETIRDVWIGKGSRVRWPARSPDLTSPDFYLWGYLKDVVYRERPTTRENMMERIRAACNIIPRDVLLRTVTNFERRIQYCQQHAYARTHMLMVNSKILKKTSMSIIKRVLSLVR
ncbi:hypothetical protein X777_05281 [Ooceraea biroi]|uniref:Tc1-like transposase DDE domain-containing protein n=1 Tax=Ooceraea biroi TaxID=2015173 RepID=A0A026WHN1_OOCBI|nr:hypothetical protein X777_05281 [Ooceraea biroi]